MAAASSEYACTEPSCRPHPLTLQWRVQLGHTQCSCGRSKGRRLEEWSARDARHHLADVAAVVLETWAAGRLERRHGSGGPRMMCAATAAWAGAPCGRGPGGGGGGAGALPRRGWGAGPAARRGFGRRRPCLPPASAAASDDQTAPPHTHEGICKSDGGCTESLGLDGRQTKIAHLTSAVHLQQFQM